MRKLFILPIIFILIWSCEWSPEKIQVVAETQLLTINISLEDSVNIDLGGYDLELASLSKPGIIEVVINSDDTIELLALTIGSVQVQLEYTSSSIASESSDSKAYAFINVTVTEGIPLAINLGEVVQLNIADYLSEDDYQKIDSVKIVLSEGGPDSGLTAYKVGANPPAIMLLGKSPGTFSLELVVYDNGGIQVAPLTFETNISVKKRVLAELFTNAGCTGCPQANNNLDVNMETYSDDLTVIRYHVWWPGVDPMFDFSAEKVEHRYYHYSPPYIIAPTLVIDGNSQGGDISVEGWGAQINQQSNVPTDLHIWDAHAENSIDSIFVTYRVENFSSPLNDISVWSVLTQDSIFYAGSNGESNHDQVMRDMDFSTVLTLDKNILNEHALHLPPDFSISSDFNLVVFIQDNLSKEIIQSRVFSIPALFAVLDI